MEDLKSLGLGASLHLVDASEQFLAAVSGEVEPERKRLAIGNAFLEVSDREASRLDLAGFVLGQGTIYPDTVETGGTKRADVIKTHHNRVPQVGEMIRQGRVVEPLKDLYKVEVRELARRLGVPDRLLERHPFPGPGLGIRVLCARGPVEGDTAEADKALARELAGTGLTGRILPIHSVGVKADLRSYERPVLLAGPDPGHQRLLELAARVYKEVSGVNRCVYDLGRDPVSEVEVVPATLTRERLDLARELDAFVMAALERHRLMRVVWQCPTVLVPVRINRRGRELVVLRPVLSERAMTARPAELGAALLGEVTEFAARFPEVSRVAVDLTTKPPGTIEWE
jgi:GMP synthase (glutamine-hydrolysing)